MVEWEKEDSEEIGEGVGEELGEEQLPWDLVYAARSEEVGFMMEKDIWTLKPVAECWEIWGGGRRRLGGLMLTKGIGR